MKFTPLNDKLLIRKIKAPEFTPGGLTIPQSARDNDVNKGTVIAVGPGRILDNGTRLTPQVRPEQMIVYGNYAGTEVTLDNEKFFILREDEILGILDDG